MPLTLVVSDTPLTGDISQGLSPGSRSSYLCSIKYLLLDESCVISDYEYDDLESFMEDEAFMEQLICEIEVRPAPFVFGKLDDLFLGVINDSGEVLWSAEDGNLNNVSSTSVTFNPESIEFEVNNNRELLSIQGNLLFGELDKIKIPRRGYLIKVYTYEEDKPGTPLKLDGDLFDADYLELVVIDGELFNDDTELIGFYWKGHPLDIYGQGGAGAFVEYSFFSLEDGDACEINI